MLFLIFMKRPWVSWYIRNYMTREPLLCLSIHLISTAGHCVRGRAGRGVEPHEPVALVAAVAEKRAGDVARGTRVRGKRGERHLDFDDSVRPGGDVQDAYNVIGERRSQRQRGEDERSQPGGRQMRPGRRPALPARNG